MVTVVHDERMYRREVRERDLAEIGLPIPDEILGQRYYM